jgi:hypothetical protein
MTDSFENTKLHLKLDREIGGLTAITNKLTGETYTVTGVRGRTDVSCSDP